VSDSLGDLTQLTDLRLSGNILSGTIPPSIEQLSLLQFLVVGGNFLVGPIPDVFATYSQLDTADFSTASLTGTIPASIFMGSTLRLLYLNNNMLGGTIPTTFSSPPLLRDFFVNNNQLTGAIPDIAAGSLLGLNEFVLQVNMLAGSMPQSVCALRSEGILEDLFADCGGAQPSVVCEFPACCNRCFEGGVATDGSGATDGVDNGQRRGRSLQRSLLENFRVSLSGLLSEVHRQKSQDLWEVVELSLGGEVVPVAP
jgi:hypothetical protein